jgi:hypothetical protein
MAAPQQQVNSQQANMMARNAILAAAKDMWLPIYTTLPVGAIAGQVINVPVRNVGLIKRFVIEITGHVNLIDSGAAGTSTMTLTEFGLANLLSNIQLTDLNNQQRINTSGWHLHFLASARRQAAFGAAFYSSDVRISGAAAATVMVDEWGRLTTQTGQGPHFDVNDAPNAVASVAAAVTTNTFRFFYEVPVAYGDYDLRGAIYANVVNATMNLQMTFNPAAFTNGPLAPAVGSADTTNAVYAVTRGVTWVSNTITIDAFTVYQNFLDQLPMTQNGPVLPLLDLSHAYMLQLTAFSGMTAGQDFPLPYANFRQFLSTTIVIDDSTATTFLSGIGGIAGSNVNFFALETANFTNLFRVDAFMAKLWEREIMNTELPRGTYYFDSRRQPVITTQQGNTQLIVNLNAAGATSSILAAWEMLALIGQVTQAGSLPA